MGLLGPDQVAPIPMLLDPEIIDGTDDTTVTVSSAFRTTTIADIVAKHGPRTPSVATSQKHFESAFVIVSERLLQSSRAGVHRYSRARHRDHHAW